MPETDTVGHESLSAEDLRAENVRLRARVEELEAALEEPLSTVDAIREGLVDAVVIDRDATPEVMTLESANDMYLRFVQRAAKVGTWQWDLETGHLNGSDTFWEMLGEKPQRDASFSDWERHVPSDQRPEFAEQVEAAVENDTHFSHELQVEGPTGQYHCLDVRGCVLHSADGQRHRLVGICMDITQRKRNEEALREADKRKDEFLATLAHELRNPLAPLRNSLDLLRMETSLEASTKRIYRMMQQQVSNLVRIVDDLLEVARISAGKVQIHQGRVDIRAVVDAAVETSRPLIEAAKHELNVSLPDGLLVVKGDTVRLCQVLVNLLNNAAKYTEHGGRIWLTVERRPPNLVISVRDTGRGMAAEILPSIFDMFVQSDRDHKHSQGGLGIGLALSKNIIERHGGRIEARSAGIDRGSEFVLYLPLTEEQLPVESSDRKKEQRSIAAHNILVVDDNCDGAKMFASLLKVLGHSVVVVNDGRSALEHLEQHRPDVVFLDLGMPRMSGYEVARQIRVRPELKGLRLIALTGWGQTEDRERTREAGFDHHLVKPVDIESLRQILASPT